MIAKELEVPVLALSQLSRLITGRKGQRPMLSDLRESGAIEQDADIVMFIHRPDLAAEEKEVEQGKIKKNVAEIILAKNRAGECNSSKAKNRSLSILQPTIWQTPNLRLSKRRISGKSTEKRATLNTRKPTEMTKT